MRPQLFFRYYPVVKPKSVNRIKCFYICAFNNPHPDSFCIHSTKQPTNHHIPFPSSPRISLYGLCTTKTKGLSASSASHHQPNHPAELLKDHNHRSHCMFVYNKNMLKVKGRQSLVSFCEIIAHRRAVSIFLWHTCYKVLSFSHHHRSQVLQCSAACACASGASFCGVFRSVRFMFSMLTCLCCRGQENLMFSEAHSSKSNKVKMVEL